MLLIYDAFHVEASSEVGCDVCPFLRYQGAFHLVQDLSKDQRCGRAAIWGSREQRLSPPVRWSSPSWDWKGGGFSALPSGADPRTERRAPTLQPALSKRKVFRPWSPVSCLSWLAVWVSFPGSGPWFSFPGLCVFPVCFFFLSLFLSFGRGRHVPAPGEGTDPRNGTGRRPKDWFSRYSSTYDFLVYLVAPVLYFVFHFVILFSAYDAHDHVDAGSQSVRTSKQKGYLSKSELRAHPPEAGTHRNGTEPGARDADTKSDHTQPQSDSHKQATRNAPRNQHKGKPWKKTLGGTSNNAFGESFQLMSPWKPMENFPSSVHVSWVGALAVFTEVENPS